MIELEACVATQGEQRVQEGAEHVPLLGTWVEDQRSGGVAYLVRKSRNQLHRAGIRLRGPSVMISLEGTTV
jgi:hypothetical protein